LEVKGISSAGAGRIKGRATLECLPEVREDGAGPRRVKPTHLEEVKKKPKGYSKAIRATRSADRLKSSA
jgi:hypothetical protein